MRKSGPAVSQCTIYLEAKNITVPVPRHPGNVPIGTLRAIVMEAGMTVEEVNAL